MINLRDICFLTPRMQNFYRSFLREMDAAKLRFRLTSVARDYKTQVALYAQGRQRLEETNLYRHLAGLPPIGEKENSRKITWTLNSKHVIRTDDSDLSNDFSRAFDIVLYHGPEIHYDIKVDTNGSAGPDYDEAGRIGESVGLRWGGRFRNPDRPHFEDPEG